MCLGKSQKIKQLTQILQNSMKNKGVLTMLSFTYCIERSVNYFKNIILCQIVISVIALQYVAPKWIL